MYVAHGFGKDVDVVGGYSAFGFGILELFPDGITPSILEVVYKQLRTYNVPLENRYIKVYARTDSNEKIDPRVITVFKEARSVDIPEDPRENIVYIANRQSSTYSREDKKYYMESRIIEVEAESRVSTVQKQNRIITVKRNS